MEVVSGHVIRSSITPPALPGVYGDAAVAALEAGRQQPDGVVAHRALHAGQRKVQIK